jgi:Small nuclear RNA activating complex (SNAPc), subunit 1
MDDDELRSRSVCCRLFSNISKFGMRVAPSPSSAKGEVRLQPSYFTSSLYVNPFREDVSRLIEAFRTQYLHLRPTQPFSLFKSIWNAQGWKWVHLRVFDARAREAFLKVSVRVFLGVYCAYDASFCPECSLRAERIVATESTMTRVVALFGLYTFFSTQPESPAPPIYAIKHVPIPIGTLQ